MRNGASTAGVIKVRRWRGARRAGSWILLTGWIFLPLMPMIAFGLSKFLGLEF